MIPFGGSAEATEPHRFRRVPFFFSVLSRFFNIQTEIIFSVAIANVVDYTAATFPVLFADKNLDKKDESYKPLSPLDEEVWNEYDAEAYHNGSVGLQLVCGKFEEEKCIQIMGVLETVLKT